LELGTWNLALILSDSSCNIQLVSVNKSQLDRSNKHNYRVVNTTNIKLNEPGKYA